MVLNMLLNDLLADHLLWSIHHHDLLTLGVGAHHVSRDTASNGTQNHRLNAMVLGETAEGGTSDAADRLATGKPVTERLSGLQHLNLLHLLLLLLLPLLLLHLLQLTPLLPLIRTNMTRKRLLAGAGHPGAIAVGVGEVLSVCGCGIKRTKHEDNQGNQGFEHGSVLSKNC